MQKISKEDMISSIQTSEALSGYLVGGDFWSLLPIQGLVPIVFRSEPRPQETSSEEIEEVLDSLLEKECLKFSHHCDRAGNGVVVRDYLVKDGSFWLVREYVD